MGLPCSLGLQAAEGNRESPEPLWCPSPAPAWQYGSRPGRRDGKGGDVASLAMPVPAGPPRGLPRAPAQASPPRRVARGTWTRRRWLSAHCDTRVTTLASRWSGSGACDPELASGRAMFPRPASRAGSSRGRQGALRRAARPTVPSPQGRLHPLCT